MKWVRPTLGQELFVASESFPNYCLKLGEKITGQKAD